MVSKSGNLSMREILVLTSAYARTSVPTLGEGVGSPKATRRGGGGQYYFFLAGNRAVLWATSVAKRLLTSVEVLTLRKISNIYLWKEKVQKNTQLSFWWKAKSLSYEICLRGGVIFVVFSAVTSVDTPLEFAAFWQRSRRHT